MAFFTCIKSSVPILGESETEEGPSNPSPLSFTTPTPSSLNPTPLPTEEEGLRPGFSTETVDTLTEDDLGKDRGNSQNSTPTPNRQIERFVYEVDPELGAFVWSREQTPLNFYQVQTPNCFIFIMKYLSHYISKLNILKLIKKKKHFGFELSWPISYAMLSILLISEYIIVFAFFGHQILFVL